MKHTTYGSRWVNFSVFALFAEDIINRGRRVATQYARLDFNKALSERLPIGCFPLVKWDGLRDQALSRRYIDCVWFLIFSSCSLSQNDEKLRNFAAKRIQNTFCDISIQY